MSITLRTTPRIAGVPAPASDLAGFVRRFCEAPVFGSDLTVAIMNWMLAVDMTETNDDLVVTSASIAALRRSCMLPCSVDVDKNRAKLNKGMLTVHVPTSAKVKGRQIAVTAG